MPRPKSPPPSYEFIKPPVEGKERQIQLCHDMVEWCFSDPLLAEENKAKPESDKIPRKLDYKTPERFENLPRSAKIIRAVEIIQNDDSNGIGMMFEWARNQLRERGFDPNVLEDRKLAFLVANGCRATTDLLEIIQRDTLGETRSNAGSTFNQAWKDLMEKTIAECGFNKDESFKLFDGVFDSRIVLDSLAEENSINYVNGLEAELAAYWYLVERNEGIVKFADRVSDTQDKVDLVLVKPDDSVSLIQVKSNTSDDVISEFNTQDDEERRKCFAFFDSLNKGQEQIDKFRKNFYRLRKTVAREQHRDIFRTIEGKVVFMPIRKEKADLRSRVASKMRSIGQEE